MYITETIRPGWAKQGFHSEKQALSFEELTQRGKDVLPLF